MSIRLNSSKKSPRLVYIKTFGCQMNNYDSEIMAGVLTAHGHKMTDNPSEADIILLNTCSIRDKAEQKVYSQVGRYRPYKDKNHNLIIGVGGCVGQLVGEEILKKAPLVDLVFGTSNI
ncbi:MAG: tRNA (N6-isopentenyl adenosine(37)-C2)-methylthiotransferase MiaB, partial [Nitrospinota bacterium]